MSFYILLADCDENITTRDRVTGKEETLFFNSFAEANDYGLNFEKLKENEFFICENKAA
jgi:hypothetical protein